MRTPLTSWAPTGLLQRDQRRPPQRVNFTPEAPQRARRLPEHSFAVLSRLERHLTKVIAEPGAWFADDRATVLAAQPALRPIWVLNSTRWLVGPGPLRSR